MVTAAELDRAVAAGTAEVTRPNARPIRCTVVECRRSCLVGQARRLWIDGHLRGFACPPCAAGVRRDMGRRRGGLRDGR